MIVLVMMVIMIMLVVEMTLLVVVEMVLTDSTSRLEPHVRVVLGEFRNHLPEMTREILNESSDS